MTNRLNRTIVALSLVFGGISADTASCQAQANYKTALGLRLNEGAGVTVKHFVTENTSIEGILYTRWRGFNLTGLYQANMPVFDEPGFLFFMGGGAHIGVWDRAKNPWWKDEEYNDTRTVVGLDGQIGLEYTFGALPLNLALDWKPAINLVGAGNFWGTDLALSIRYAFK